LKCVRIIFKISQKETIELCVNEKSKQPVVIRKVQLLFFIDILLYINFCCGNDVLAGGNNSDVLNGGAGNDILIGGDGEDVLRGGEGDDILTGGLRSDAFDFSGDFGNDVITDFDDNQDGVFFESADKEDITTENFREGTLITVESDITNGSVLLLGIDDVDGLNV
jgi:Ca2+-binding RTX toxin-like protein